MEFAERIHLDCRQKAISVQTSHHENGPGMLPTWTRLKKRRNIVPKFDFQSDDSLNAITYENDRIVKMEVDYSFTCDETLPKCKEMAKNETRFNEALEMLLQLEKQARIVSIVGWVLCSLF